MKILFRLARIAFLLTLALSAIVWAATLAGPYFGDRIYLRNDANCSVQLMSEHEGLEAKPGELVLIKPGFIERTPTMLIAHLGGIWRSGLHFSIDKLSIRGEPDISIPPTWLKKEFLGAKLTYSLNQSGQLSVVASDGASPVQPVAFSVELGGKAHGRLCPSGIE